MIKTSVSGGADTKTVFYETYHGVYVTANYEVALSNYLVHLPSHKDSIVEIDV